MIIVLKREATEEQREHVIQRIEGVGLMLHVTVGTEITIIEVIGSYENINKEELIDHFTALDYVAEVKEILEPYKLVRKAGREGKRVKIGSLEFSPDKLIVIAGPCSVESREQLFDTARIVKEAGAHILRGGCFKPRTGPYGFQGLGEDGLKILVEAKKEFGLPVITEVMSKEHVELAVKYDIDILQIGARNAQNFELLKEAGKAGKPVFLKRGLAEWKDEYLLSAEYIAYGQSRSWGNGEAGNKEKPINLILCLRGIRGIDDKPKKRFTADLDDIPILKDMSWLPVFYDPSHATGDCRYVPAQARAGVAIGADGLMIEVHPRPEEAKTDGPQSLKFDIFLKLMVDLKRIARYFGREI
jgi:3-deoxy-7-phosphoheptulonate synthase